jgi:hypothetical protein
MARYRTIYRQPWWLIVLGLTLGWTALGGGIDRASAQSPIAPAASEPPGSAAASGAMPGLPDPTRGIADAVDAVAADVAAEPPSFVPETLPTDGSPGPGMGLLGMVRESMWGNHSDLWRPLPLSTFFSDGWAQPWYTYPRSSTGAPRQAWINAADGVFYRLWFAQFSYANNFQQNGNAYNGTYAIFTPISQRFQFLFMVPFIESNKGGLNNTYHGNFGDFAVSPRFLLSETQDFSQVVECVVRTPTGNTVNGNGQTTLTPEYEFWYGGLPGAGVIRGSVGATIPLNSAGTTSTVPGVFPAVTTTAPGSRTTVNYNLSIGKYWTPHDVPLGDFVTYLSINGFTTVDNRGPLYSYLSVTPGFRFHLANNYYFSAGIEVPLTGPKSQNFTYSPIFWIVKVW